MATVTEIASNDLAAFRHSRRPALHRRDRGLCPSYRPVAQHLPLAQVHAALAYYHANKAGIDTDLEADSREAETLGRRLGG